MVPTVAKTWSRPTVNWGVTPYDLVQVYRSSRRMFFCGGMTAFQTVVGKFLPHHQSVGLTNRRLCGPPNLLFSGYVSLFSWVKPAVAWSWPLSSIEPPSIPPYVLIAAPSADGTVSFVSPRLGWSLMCSYSGVLLKYRCSSRWRVLWWHLWTHQLQQRPRICDHLTAKTWLIILKQFVRVA